MCHPPSVNIVHGAAHLLLVYVVGQRVVGTEDEVLRRVFQNLVNLGLQFLPRTVFDGTAVVQTTQHRAAEQTADLVGWTLHTLNLREVFILKNTGT